MLLQTSSKRRLKFTGHPLDLGSTRSSVNPRTDNYNIMAVSPKTPRSGTSSRSSDSPLPSSRSHNIKMPAKIKTMDITEHGEVKLKTVQGGNYSVTSTDASLIGRIAHKAAPRRTQRVLQPHEVFIELEELRSGSVENLSDLEWEETARWIKFEEDVEQDTGRWGRPHVSALAFHSVVELRKGLEKG